MDSIEPTFSKLGGNLILRKIVKVVWTEPVPNFYGFPKQHAPDCVGYDRT